MQNVDTTSLWQGSYPKIGVFVVTFNASATISHVLARIKPETWEKIAEVFIFDDNSQDNTAQVASNYKYVHQLDKVKVYHNQVNLAMVAIKSVATFTPLSTILIS